MNDNYIYEDILEKSIKIARVIDDSVERDNALSNIAQIQTALNCPDDALETISLIRYDDIRADAVRKSLDNLLARYSSNNKSLPQLDFWLDKLMEDTMAIPEPEIRCPKLHTINLLILSRLEDKEKAISILKMTRREFALLDNVRKRSKYLFAVYQMFQQMNDQTEAVSTLKSILKRISEYRPTVEQGVMLGMVAHEYWKMKEQQFAIECIHHADSAKAQSYGFLQLIKLLAVSGKVDDAQPFIDLLESEKLKGMGMHFIEMGKSIISHVSKMPGAIISINKSRFFRNSSKKNSSDYYSNSESEGNPRPVWCGFTVSITSEKIAHPENDADNAKQSDETNDDEDNDSNSEEVNLDKYDWDKYDWDSIKENHRELTDLWNDNEEDDFEEEDSDDDNSDEEDEDDVDGYLDSEDDEDEEDEESNDDNDEDGDNNDRSDLTQKIRKLLDLFSATKTDKELTGFSPRKVEPFVNYILRKFSSRNSLSGLDIDRILNERFFCITESIQGTVSFNRTLPPSLFQVFLHKLTQFFSILNKDNNTRIVSDSKERIEEYITRQKEIGFDSAWQEVISQGNYSLAVECALNHFCSLNKDKMFLGYESSLLRYDSHPVQDR